MTSCNVSMPREGGPRVFPLGHLGPISSLLLISLSNCSFDFYHLLLNSDLLRFYEQAIITVSTKSIILQISKWKINIEK